MWTWLCGLLPLFLGIMYTPPGRFIFYFGGGAPTVVGGILVLKTFPRKQKIGFFRSYFDFRGLKLKWFIWVILYFAIIAATGIYISVKIFYQPMPGMNWLKTIIQRPYTLPVFLFLSFISGPLNEEIGWRGYSLDRLFIRFGYVKSNLILGFIWCIWHLFWYFNPDQAQYYLLKHSFAAAFLYLPSVIVLNFVVSFIYIQNNRSIFAGWFVHMMSNFITSQLLINSTVETSLAISLAGITIGLAVIIYSLTSKKFIKQYEKVMIDFKQTIDMSVNS
jgi:membrane protease YdiL (CAAX protease family)